MLGILSSTLANHKVASAVGVWGAELLNRTVLGWLLSLSFIAFGAWTLFPDRAETPGESRRWGLLLTTTVVFFFAEMGDKTQLATVALGARFASTVQVTIGTTQAGSCGLACIERAGVTPIDQQRWVDSALEMFGRVFGGATAYPKAQGIWRDDERGGALVKDEPVVVHCYTTPADIEDARKLAELGDFCRRMGRDARQGEVGLVIGDEYFAIRDFAEE